MLVDGEPLPVKSDGSFEGWVKVNLGSALVIELRDGTGRRALILHPTRPRSRLPGPRRTAVVEPAAARAARVASPPARSGELSLTMRGGATVRSGWPQAPRVRARVGARLGGRPRRRAGRRRASRALRRRGARPRFRRSASRRARGQPRRRAPVPAAQLRLDLPPRGAVLKSHELTIRGQSHLENKVTINGGEVSLGPDGSFTHTVKLPDGKSELVVETLDRQGNRGKLRWPVEVSDRALFLMAMAEGAIGQVGAELDGETDHSRLEAGPVMLHGRAVLYLKGRIQGRWLFRQYFVTAHVDTAKQREFEAFFDQVIDPNRFYPIYGDSSLEVRDVNARDKYYLLVEADRSSLLWETSAPA